MVPASIPRGVIVQTLWTRWTNRSRGPAAAVRRNDTPEYLPLNVARLSETEAAWHDVEFLEPHFLPVEMYRERALPSDFRQITLELGSGWLSASVFGSTRFRLAPGQSGRIVYNRAADGQLGGARDTEFHKVVLHVAFGLTARPDLFLRPPEQSFVSLRNLT